MKKVNLDHENHKKILQPTIMSQIKTKTRKLKKKMRAKTRPGGQRPYIYTL